MKISYRTHPMLKTLHDMAKIEPFDEASKRNSEIYRRAVKNTIMLSQSFQEAVSLGFDKLQRNELFDEIRGVSGTIIKGDTVLVYDIIDRTHYQFHEYDRWGDVISWQRYDDEVKEVYIEPALESTLTITPQEYALFTAVDVITTLIFIKYAEVETKLLPARLRTKDVDCKYMNDTNLDIQRMDMRWFTTLTRTEGFSVRGHFRCQACGVGYKDREIIWIHPHMKSGYTAPARKLSNV